MESDYQYQQLPEADSIRLLRLEAGSQEDPIQCSLFTAQLSDDPEFEAVSYVWGDISNKEVISCGNVTSKIGANLYTALKAFRLAEHDRILWTDAICIHQTNIPERDIQVRLMGQLYAQAKRVLIWLGTADEHETQLALTLINEMLGLAAARSPIFRTTYNAMTWFKTVPQEQKDALEAILCRSWMDRAWVFQEAVKAQEAVFHIGNVSIPWSVLNKAVNVLKNTRLYKTLSSDRVWRGISALDTIEMIRIGYIKRDRHFFLSILRCNQHRKASDPRDKIIALLGVIDPSDADKLAVSYQMTASNVYTQLAVFFVAQRNDIDFLEDAAQPPPDFPLQTPSWVPNWLYLGTTAPLSINQPFYNAAGNTTAEATASADRKILLAKGQGVDIVARIVEADSDSATSNPAKLGLDYSSDRFYATAQLIMAYWKLAFDTMGEEVKEDLSQAELEPFCRALMRDCRQDQQRGLAPAGVSDAYAVYTYVRLCAARVSLQAETFQRYVDQLGIEERAAIAEAELNCAPASRWNFCVTVHGRYAWLPQPVRVGDEIVILYGARIPMIVRPCVIDPDDCDGPVERPVHQIIGHGYVQGIMNGEALDNSKAEMFRFQ